MNKGLVIGISATAILATILGIVGYKQGWFSNKASEKQFNDFTAPLKGTDKKWAGLGYNDLLKNKAVFLNNVRKSDANFLLKVNTNSPKSDITRALKILYDAGLPVSLG